MTTGHDGGCFGCGSDNPIGLKLRCTAGPGLSLRASVVPAATNLRCIGPVPFGIISAILEESMGLLGGLVPTSMHVEHLSIDCDHFPHAEQELTVEAAIDEIVGDRICTSAVARSVGGRLVATATGTYVAEGALRPVRLFGSCNNQKGARAAEPPTAAPCAERRPYEWSHR
ncbi:hypothetical protein [Rhodococcus opacus]|uniref:Thioesterase domain-containing protein n=1 Tax=Rhodococcus opacus (strain B4) TaxID=632772 RepID=C1B3K0_RHOOB|nr:hypothetical protein [Rhodococcus opacus]BAH50698.1 hypothetical protein ROP_24510 [Rhodococcus opacus B4]